MEHKYIEHKDCIEPNCYICDGGLAVCEVCSGAEGSLTTECCGKKLSFEQQNQIYAGILDFKNNNWIRKVEK
jgi:hypothetical protein